MLRAAATLRDEARHHARRARRSRYTDCCCGSSWRSDDGRWGAPVEAGGALLDHPVTEFARTILRQAVQTAAQDRRQARRPAGEELHQLRIAARRCATSRISFEASIEENRRKFIAALAEVQDQLGSLNDAIVSRSCCWGSRGALRTPTYRGGPPRQRLVLGWQAARIDRDLAIFRPPGASCATVRRSDGRGGANPRHPAGTMKSVRGARAEIGLLPSGHADG